MNKISLILIIFFFLIGQDIAEPSDTSNVWEAMKKVDEDKTLNSEEKRKVKALLYYEHNYKWNSKLEEEAENRRKEEDEIWKLIGQNNYTAALQKVDKAKHIGEKAKFKLEQIIKLIEETDIPTPTNKAKAVELKIKKMELKILSLEGDLEKSKDELQLIDSRRNRDVSGIEIRLLKLENRLDSLERKVVDKEKIR